MFCYALYLLPKWRETRAYPLVIRWLSLSEAASTPFGRCLDAGRRRERGAGGGIGFTLRQRLPCGGH